MRVVLVWIELLGLFPVVLLFFHLTFISHSLLLIWLTTPKIFSGSSTPNWPSRVSSEFNTFSISANSSWPDFYITISIINKEIIQINLALRNKEEFLNNHYNLLHYLHHYLCLNQQNLEYFVLELYLAILSLSSYLTSWHSLYHP